jgi:hypothetical protein
MGTGVETVSGTRLLKLQTYRSLIAETHQSIHIETSTNKVL